MSTLALDDIEMCLDAAGLPWSRRDQGWAVPAAGDVTRELLVLPADDGLTVDAVLIEWDEATPVCREALALFLANGERDVGGIQCVIEGTRARVVARVPADRVEAGLAEALKSVSAGCRLLAREARALLAPDLAGLYLGFHQGGPGA